MVYVSIWVFLRVCVRLSKRRSSHSLLVGPAFERTCTVDQRGLCSTGKAQPSTNIFPSLSFWKNVKCEEEEILRNFSFLLIFLIFFSSSGSVHLRKRPVFMSLSKLWTATSRE